MEHSSPLTFLASTWWRWMPLPPMTEDGSLSCTVCQTSTFFDFSAEDRWG